MTRLDGHYCLQVDGLHPTDAIGLIDANFAAIEMQIARGDLPAAIQSRQPFIAFVVEGTQGHAVLIQGVLKVDGFDWLIIRDPARGAYRQRLVDFDARLVQNQSGVDFPTVWAIL